MGHKRKYSRVKILISMFAVVMIFITGSLVNLPFAQAAGKVELNYKTLMMTQGTTKTLNVKNLKKGTKVTWKSGNSKIATVNKNGKVTAVKNGSTTIHAKAGKKTYNCKVSVKKKAVKTQKEIDIVVGNKTFKAVLYDNKAAKEFTDLLPLTLNMAELNNNEKFYQFSHSFSTEPEVVGNIKSGDLMIYQSDYVVLFYDSFKTSYRYTKLGYIKDVTGLTTALGKSSVKVTFQTMK